MDTPGSNTTAHSLAIQLRQAADWIDAHPVNANVHVDWRGIQVYVHPRNVEELREVRRAIGSMEKHKAASGGMKLEAVIEDVEVCVFAPSDVCHQVQVGTERRPVVETVETGEFEDVPVYEWDCGAVLADEPEAVSA